MSQSLIYNKTQEFKHIIRVMNTNLDGRRRVAYALCSIKGVGLRLSHLVCKLVKVDLNARAGSVGEDVWNKIAEIIADPEGSGVPVWFLNRRRDYKSGKNMHVSSNGLDSKIREDIEKMKKIRQHRGLRHHWLLKVRGQMTKSTGRRGVAIGVIRKSNKQA